MNKVSVKLRTRVCHGWAFRDHNDLEKNAIVKYLDTGEITEHFPDSYRRLHQAAEEGKLGR